ncbi:hypothetical protein C4J93_0466 [Pseudomonas sp. R2-37-08W]|nr:hypothetical protein C4J93_0466 [Pseudomonas sp. R2-37-08W]
MKRCNRVQPFLFRKFPTVDRKNPAFSRIDFLLVHLLLRWIVLAPKRSKKPVFVLKSA